MAGIALAVSGAFVAGAGLSYLMRPKPPKQQLGEIRPQTAREGEPRLIVWGIVRPIGGNLITPRKLFRRVRRSNPPVVAGIYAIGVCEGPITGFRRIWRNEKLVYDGRGTEWGRRNNAAFLRQFRLHLGGWDQMPDPLLQSAFGVDAAPAFRGTAYMVAVGLYGLGEDLSDTGGAVPQWAFEVERAHSYTLTSRPYPATLDESVAVSPEVTELYLSQLRELSAPDESVTVAPEVLQLRLSPVYEDSEAVAVLPEVHQLRLSPLYNDQESVTAVPEVVRLHTSLYYDIAPDSVTVAPEITELTLT